MPGHEFTVTQMGMLALNKVRKFKEDGYLKVESILDVDTVELIRGEINRLSKNPPPGLSTTFEPVKAEETSQSSPVARKIRNISQHSEMILKLATTGRLPALAASLLEKPVGFYGDQVLFKAAKVGSAKPLHQDLAYFRIEPADAVITIWCSLDAADKENGCMCYIPASHTKGILQHFHTPETPHLVAESEERALAIPTSIGDCVVHHSLTLHKTAPNTSSKPRLALIFHYVNMNATFPHRSSGASPIIMVKNSF